MGCRDRQSCPVSLVSKVATRCTEDSLEEERGLTKDERGTDKVLVGEREGGGETSLEVDPFEQGGPITRPVRLGELDGRLDFLANTSVLVVDIVALDVADESSEGPLGLVVLVVQTQPGFLVSC